MARKRAAKPPEPPFVTRGRFEPPEAPAERASRLRREEAITAHRLSRDRIILVATLAVTGLVFVVAVAVLALSSQADARSWAMATITSVATAYLGYWGGTQAQGKGV